MINRASVWREGVGELLVKKVRSYPPQSIGRRVANRGLMRRGPLATPVE